MKIMLFQQNHYPSNDHKIIINRLYMPQINFNYKHLIEDNVFLMGRLFTSRFWLI